MKEVTAKLTQVSVSETKLRLYSMINEIQIRYCEMIEGFALIEWEDLGVNNVFDFYIENYRSKYLRFGMSFGEATPDMEYIKQFRDQVLNYVPSGGETIVARALLEYCKKEIGEISKKFTEEFEKIFKYACQGNIKVNFSGQRDIIDILYHAYDALISSNHVIKFCPLTSNLMLDNEDFTIELREEDEHAVRYLVSYTTGGHRDSTFRKGFPYQESRAQTGAGLSDMAVFINAYKLLG